MDKYDHSPGSERDDFVRTINRRHHQALYAFTLGLCRRFRFDPSYADDLMQEFYYELLSKYEEVAEGYARHGIKHLCRIIQYDILDLTRKRKSLGRVEQVFAHRLPASGNIHYLCYEMCTGQMLEKLQVCLKERDYRVMKLYLEGFAYDEIGRLLNMNHSTVGTVIYRAKKAIAQYYDGDPVEKH